MKTHSLAIAAATVVLGVAAHAPAALVIDTFDSVDAPNPWPIELTAVGTTTVNETGIGGSALGGARTTIIEATYIDLEALDEVRVAVAAGAGVLDFASTVGAAGNMSLVYDGGVGNLEQSIAGFSAIEIDFSLFDFPSGSALPTTVTLFDGANAAELTIELASSGAQTVSFDLASFSGIGSLDPSSLDSIRVDFEGSLGTDFRITEIRAVPAPGALALLGLGLGIAGTRRRR